MRITRRRKLSYKDHGVAFAHARTPIPVAATTTRARRVFILGDAPNTATILGQAQQLDGAEIYAEGTYPVITVPRREGGDVRVSYAGSWFGEGDYTTDDCVTVWKALRTALRDAWRDPDVEILMTPATTGRDLWQRTIPHDGWPVMSDAAQSAVRSISGQGRIQSMPAPKPGALIPALYEYDARLAYVSCMRELPIGEPRYVESVEARDAFDIDAHRPAKYLVSFTVPDGWQGRPGILPVPVGREGWQWPATPGYEPDVPVWVDACELWCAQKWGWSFGIHAGLIWPAKGDPLRTWQTRLVKLLDQGPDAEPLRAMWRHAVRAMLLFALGAMHGAGRKVTGVGDEPPVGATHATELPDGRMTWTFREPTKWPEMAHPEWTSTVWARARVRLLDAPGKAGALHLAPGTVVALRTDAIYTTQPTGWADDGRIGRYRLKASYRGGPWPRSGSDVLLMKRIPQ